jgi:hypothetical protein
MAVQCFSTVGGQKTTEVVVEGRITVPFWGGVGVILQCSQYIDYIVYRTMAGRKVKPP